MGGYRPGLEQGLLARVALLDDEAALRAWTMWREVRGERGLERTSPATHHILPMAAWRLDRLPYDGWQLPRLRGVHKKSFARNALLWHRVKPTVTRLLDAGLAPMLVGPFALARRLYPDPGARHLDRCDVMVRPEDLPRAVDVLEAEGVWRATLRQPRARVRFHESQRWHGESGLDLVLKTHLTPASITRADADAGLWREAEPFIVDGLPLLTPPPLETLIGIAVDGLVWTEHSHCEWVIDLGLAVRRWGLDEPALMARARHHRVTRLMHLALVELAGVGVPVSWDLLWNLDHAERSPTEDRHVRARAEGPPEELGALWADYRHLRVAEARPSELLPGFARYLRGRLELDGWGAALAFARRWLRDN